MDAAAWIATVAAGVSALCAIYAKRQANAAKRQANAAEEANRLTTEARETRLAAEVGLERSGETWRIFVEVINVGVLDARIQSVYALFSDGSRSSNFYPTRDSEVGLESSAHQANLLGVMKPGSKAKFELLDVSVSQTSGCNEYHPPDYSKPRWRTLKGVAVEANGKSFEARKGERLLPIIHLGE